MDGTAGVNEHGYLDIHERAASLLDRLDADDRDDQWAARKGLRDDLLAGSALALGEAKSRIRNGRDPGRQFETSGLLTAAANAVMGFPIT